MTATAARQAKAREKLIVALDVADAAAADSVIVELGDAAGAYKIGLQLFTSAGPKFVEKCVERGLRIFLDLKFHDIPNTAANAAVSAARLGVWMLNVHASGGSAMMQQTAEAVSEVCEKENLSRPLVIGVTVLTSDGRIESGTSRGGLIDVSERVFELAALSATCGLDGVVASAREARGIKEAVDKTDFLVVTPGIRPAGATNDDQKRVETPERAVAGGADYLVVGRPILQAQDRRAAVDSVLSSIAAAI